MHAPTPVPGVAPGPLPRVIPVLAHLFARNSLRMGSVCMHTKSQAKQSHESKQLSNVAKHLKQGGHGLEKRAHRGSAVWRA